MAVSVLGRAASAADLVISSLQCDVTATASVAVLGAAAQIVTMANMFGVMMLGEPDHALPYLAEEPVHVLMAQIRPGVRPVLRLQGLIPTLQILQGELGVRELGRHRHAVHEHPHARHGPACCDDPGRKTRKQALIKAGHDAKERAIRDKLAQIRRCLEFG